MLDDQTEFGNFFPRNVRIEQTKLPERGSDVVGPNAASSKCQFCHVHFSEPALLVPFEHTLEKLSEKSEGKTKRKMGAQEKTDARYEFFKVINSFLNAKGGSLLIHTNGNTNVDRFDQMVKDKLVTMIPDDALFQDVYEQRFLDNDHLSFCVKPPRRQRPLSILDFNTKFAVSAGLADPTKGQMRHFMKRVIEEENESVSLLEANRDTLVLNEGKPAMLKGFQSQDNRPLRKNICTQTKYDSKTEITEFCWTISKPYISAFSKLPGGGSVYIGMMEEKTSDRSTGGLIVKGIDASKIDQIKIQEELCKRFKTELMQIGRSKPDKPIEIEVLPVRSDKSLVVIQIKVNYYHGVCFTSSTGPDLFQAKRKKEELLVERIDVGCWLEQFRPHELHVYGGLATIK
ncbi:hypothetical protein V1264_017340 [Littorina saxatilis]|uniref:Uncharacterized protein n=1 Tax=Littorina saxatilis TaxID=31220 RepID=A0AAN9BI22_9CAEN